MQNHDLICLFRVTLPIKKPQQRHSSQGFGHFARTVLIQLNEADVPEIIASVIRHIRLFMLIWVPFL